MTTSMDDAVFASTSFRSLADHWWLLAIRGLCALVFGVLAIGWPGLTLASLVLLFAAYLVADGIFAAASSVMAARHHERWAALALEAVIGIAAAVVVFAMPVLTIYVMVMITAFWAILSGVALLVAGIRFGRGGWLMALAAAVSILFGVLLLISPAEGALVIAVWLGLYALIFGVALLGLAWHLRGLALERRVVPR